MVIKSLNKGLGDVDGISGGAILGDGKVGLILDVAGVIGIAHQQCYAPKKHQNATEESIEDPKEIVEVG